jgi:pyruvate dehydrogenase E2 component (dihydrolipoamide acetyltransferase)
MPLKILMPALSPTMTEGNIAKWLKNEGDKIAPGEVIAEIETDKATMEVEAVDAGVLAKIIIPQGTENVAVNSLIAVLIEDEDDRKNIDEFIAKFASVSAPVASEKPSTTTSPSASAPTSPAPVMASTAGGRVNASPLAKRLATINNIPISSIRGSGPHGRIIKSDVLGAIGNNSTSSAGVIIAKRLLESKQTVPHFYLNIECNIDQLLIARQQINDQYQEDKNKKLSVNDFVIKAVSMAMRDVPNVNASWGDSAIQIYNNIDVSVAVAIEGGLVTPIIRNADQKTLHIISSEMKGLAKRAKEGKLSPEEYQGGGFSISNLGMYGIKSFSAIVNPPQSCILAIGESKKRPVVLGDQIQVATIMEVTLSCDHRVVDGALAAIFLQSFRKYIESPVLLFV